MKKRLLLLVLACAMLVGCHSKLDLTDIDTIGQVELGVVLPVGTLRMTLGDFLGNGEIDRVSVDEKGLFHFSDRVDIPEKPYHHIDVASYIIKEKETLSFPIFDKLPAGIINPIPSFDLLPIPKDSALKLDFDLGLGLSGINTHTSDERIDSIWVTEATFVSNIKTTGGFGLLWKDIKSVELVLGEQFHRAEGDTILIIKDGKDPKTGHMYDFDEDIPITVTDFSLNLMKDPKDVKAGMVDSIQFHIIFKVRPSESVPYTNESAFSYTLNVKLIDYSAIWGFFEAGKDTRDARRIDMDSLWGDWKDFKKLNVRLAKPHIDLYLEHGIAAPLIMHVDSLVAIAVDSITQKETKCKASWNGKYQTDIMLEPSLSPYSYPLGQRVTNYTWFDESDQMGNIDELFEVRPDFFEYSFHMLVDRNYRFDGDYPWNQHRITKDTMITGYAIIDIPFDFKDSSEVSYSKVIDDVDISRLTLDSLLDEIDQLDSVKEGSLKCGIKIKNVLPFVIDGKFSFLDENGQDIGLEFIEDQIYNHIIIPAAKMKQDYDAYPDTAITDIVFNVKQQEFDKFADVKKIRLEAALKDNPYPAQLKADMSLSVKIALAAKLEALIDLGKKNK